VLSVIIPAYNEEDGILICIEELHQVLTENQVIDQFEIIILDDHSSDSTYQEVKMIERANIRCVRLSRRSGSHVALRAGLNLAKGESVLCMAADRQDDPSAISEMLKKWIGGYDVVWALRKDRKKESILIRIPAFAFYKLFKILTSGEGNSIDLSRADFFLLDRKVVNAINSCSERNSSLLGLINWMGFNQVGVEYCRRERSHGFSKWNFKSRWRLAKDWIVAFSGLPIKAASLLGISISILGVALAVWFAIERILYSHVLPGWASTVVFVLTLGGIQLTVLGIIGGYIWRNLDESRSRPLYFVENDTTEDGELKCQTRRRFLANQLTT